MVSIRLYWWTASLPESVLLGSSTAECYAMTNSLPRSSIPLAVLAAFAGIYVIWGTTYLAIAFAIQTVPPFVSGSARFLVAAGVMYAWLRWRAAHGRATSAHGGFSTGDFRWSPLVTGAVNPRPFAGVNIPVGLFCGVLLSGTGNGFVIWAQQGIPSGIAALIVTAVPVVVLVIDWAMFSKRAPSKQALLGIAVAVGGVATIILHTRTLAGHAQPLHVAAMIAAVVGWSFGTLIQKRAANANTVLSFTCVQMLGGGLFQLAMASINGEWQRFDMDAVSTASIVAILYLIVFGSLIGLNCYLWLLTRVSAQKVTTYALVNPVVALVLGAIVLDERVTLLAAVSAALVLIGVALVLFQGVELKAWRAHRGAQAPSS
jgi:drug/metabolite transporter (DMT)-like permease